MVQGRDDVVGLDSCVILAREVWETSGHVATFTDPLTVDFHRESNPHIVFASGFHRCLGSHLARLEIRVALEELVARLPDFRIREGHDVQFTANPRTPTNGLPLVWG